VITILHKVSELMGWLHTHTSVQLESAPTLRHEVVGFRQIIGCSIWKPGSRTSPTLLALQRMSPDRRAAYERAQAAPKFVMHHLYFNGASSPVTSSPDGTCGAAEQDGPRWRRRHLRRLQPRNHAFSSGEGVH
jgi:hypothetical protein